MAQSNYAYCGTRLHLLLEEEVADGYNRFMKAYFDAQKAFMDTHHRPWSAEDPIYIKCSQADMDSYHAVGDIINLYCKVNGGSLEITQEDITSDYLVKVD